MPNDRTNPSSSKQLSLYKLHALLDYSTLSGPDATPTLLMERFKQVVDEDLNVNRIIYFFKDEDQGWQLMLNVGCDPDVLAGLEVEEALGGYRKHTIVTSRSEPWLQGIDAVVPIIQNDEAKAYVLLGDTNDTNRGVSPVLKHLQFIQTLAYVSYISLYNFKLINRTMRQRELKQQMEVAARLQQVLVVPPERLPKMPGIEIATYYQPFYEIGGDSFDVIQLNDTTIGFCIADVAGKGIPAALLMSSFNAHFRARMNDQIPLEALVLALNDLFNSIRSGSDSFITSFIGRYNTQSHTLEYINCAQNPPLYFQRESGQPGELNSNAIGIGMLDDMGQVRAKRWEITEDTLIFCYTDGLVESRVNGRETYSSQIIEEALPHSHTAQDLVQSIQAQMKDEVAKKQREVFDDVSMVALHIRPKA